MRKGLFARSISNTTTRSTSAASLLTHSTTTAESTSAFRVSSVQRSSRAVGCRSATKRHYARASSPLYAAAASATAEKAPDMFCFQCEQTRDNKGCTTVGVCGKTPEVAALQDLLMHALKGVSMYANRARQIGGASFADAEVDSFALRALFSTLTNVNFDDKRFRDYLDEAAKMKAKAKALYERACASEGVTAGHLDGDLDPTSWTWNPKVSTEELVAQGHAVGILPRQERYGADLSGLQEMVLYGLKGLAAYADHALVLDKQSDATYAFLHSALDKLTKKDPTAEELLGLALEVGAANISVMGMLDAGATERYGHPVPTKVLTSVKKGKCVAVSGHDLRDLEEVLKQTAGKGINVYTHGELLPAHGYPGLKGQYPHLIGNYGGAWQQQKSEFAAFPGPILMTTNCIVEPRKSYRDRIYTRSVVGWPGCTHLPDYDFTKIVEHAQRMPGFAEDDDETYTMTGFARNAVLGVADKVVEAVKAGQIKHFFLIGGCDGAEGERNYFKEMALSTPKDTVVLTLACGKYRFNKHFKDFGDIGGIPRLLDVGQCNDAYSAIQIAVALAKAFNTDVNGLPLSFVISWFEQKAVAVLLSLLYLNVKNIHLGPNLPAFCTPNMLQILVDKFGIRQITDAKADMERMMQKQ